MKTITGSFTSPEQAERALNALLDHKAGIMEIGLLLRNCQPGRRRSEIVIEHAQIGAVAGAALGGFAGFAAGMSNVALSRGGLLVMISAMLTMAGFVLAGAGIATIGGGLVGALVGLDLSETENAMHNLSHLYSKNALVVVMTSDRRATAIEKIMWQAQAGDVISERTQRTGNRWLRFAEVTTVKVEEYPMS